MPVGVRNCWRRRLNFEMMSMYHGCLERVKDARKAIGLWLWNGSMVSGGSCQQVNVGKADGSLNDKEKMAEMGIKPKDAMDLAINTISAMTFSWG
jgi:hypothetical protein